jgi:hypothetical protein
MAEPLRKDEELTTADLVGRKEVKADVREMDRNVDGGPQLVPGRNNETTVERDARGAVGSTAQPTPLFSENDVTDLRSRWSTVQAGFVDEPRQAVKEADNLVASVMQRLAEGFANERATLEKQWDRGDSVSTEDLRVAFQRYRSFFDRLLKA